MAKQGSSTKQLKQTLGFWDLMSTAIGQIIGAGIMTLLGPAIASYRPFRSDLISDRSSSGCRLFHSKDPDLRCSPCPRR